jgi:hypothetical protein
MWINRTSNSTASAYTSPHGLLQTTVSRPEITLEEYHELQKRLRKHRRVTSVILRLGCLLIGFIVGMLVFGRQEVIVSANVPDSKPEAKRISL